jgi:hypothetical protein
MGDCGGRSEENRLIKWINKMWYLYTMEVYSATKKNEILLFKSKWRELDKIILSEVSQAQKVKILCSPSYADFT